MGDLFCIRLNEIVVRVFKELGVIVIGVLALFKAGSFILNARFVIVGVLEEVTLMFELLLDASEFYSPLVGSLQEYLLCVWEGLH